MSKELKENEKDDVVKTLSTIIGELPEEPGLSLKPSCYSVGRTEVEGEVIEIVTSYLCKRDCPSAAAAAFAFQTAKELLEGNLTEFELEKDVDLDNSSIQEYNSAKLARGILSNMIVVWDRWKSSIPPVHKNGISYKTSLFSIKNKRRKMEDKHSLMPHFNTAFGLDKSKQPCALFSVFDGHGGTDAASFATTQFGIHLRSSMNETGNLKECLRTAYLKTDEEFIEKAKRERLRSGCTGVTVLITKTKLYIAWIGDSQVVLCKGNTAHHLMDPHKPDREDERKRIEDLGGCVVWFGGWRVNGSLAVSRAIGDYEQKPYVSGDPDLNDYTFTGDEKFLILACDGLFDVIEPTNAVQLTLEYLQDGKSKENVAEMLVNEAKSHGSMDNITVLVIFLEDHIAKLTEGLLRTTEFERYERNTTDLSDYDVLEVTDFFCSKMNVDLSNEEFTRKENEQSTVINTVSNSSIIKDNSVTKLQSGQKEGLKNGAEDTKEARISPQVPGLNSVISANEM